MTDSILYRLDTNEKTTTNTIIIREIEQLAQRGQGQRTDVNVKAMLFQNYQAHLHLRVAQLDNKSVAANEFRFMYKGGFLLSEEIRNSTIRIKREDKNLDSSFFNAVRRSTGDSRRTMTGS